MTVKELKTYIEERGFSHKDCFELSELRDRARQAGVGRTGNTASTASAAQAAEPPDEPEQQEGDGLRERRRATQGAEKATGLQSEEEKRLKEKIARLSAESGQVISGRDASAILGEVEELKKAIAEAEASLTAAGREQLLASLKDVESSLAFENKLEQHCGRVIQITLLAVTIIPWLLSGLESSLEFALRPAMVVAPANLANMHAVVTGGCGAVGVDLAIMLANSGAEVVVSCHGESEEVAADAGHRLWELGLLRNETPSDGGGSRQGWIDVWPLQLESFASVRAFAARVLEEWSSVDILVHNAATKDGCSRTEDGHELSAQVNYLSPFLLTHLLLPALRKGAARVVHVTCDAGLQQPDWLPWPLGRTQAELLPRVDLDGLEAQQGEEGEGEGPTSKAECSPLSLYANAKLAVVVHSHELNRRLPDLLNRGVSHVVNPGAMDSQFGRSASAPAGKSSMRSSLMGNLPPVWIANKIYGYTFGKAFSAMSSGMLRPTVTGAKAIFHVATSDILGNEEHGGGLFSDTAGAFTECGKEPEECGRVPPHKQPAATSDEELAAELWVRTEQALGRRHLRPLRADGRRAA